MNIGGLIALTWSLAAIWFFVMYSKNKHNAASGITEKEAGQIDELLEIADSLAERIKTLESILDVEAPEWRSESDES